MAPKTTVNDLADMAIYEYLDIAHHSLISGKPEGGCYGYPTALLLLSIVKTIGSYHINDKAFTVTIDGQPCRIDDDTDCFGILNSPYFGQTLTRAEIQRVYEFYKCLSICNPAAPKPHFLAIGTPIDPVFSRDEQGGITLLNLVPFYHTCVRAVSQFLQKNSPKRP